MSEPKLKIRRYIGHDCDSIQGFNNGYYLDSESIEVTDIDAAFKSCHEALVEYFGTSKLKITELDNGYEVITGHFDNDGNDLTESEFNELNEVDQVGSWRYIYVSYEVTND